MRKAIMFHRRGMWWLVSAVYEVVGAMLCEVPRKLEEVVDRVSNMQKFHMAGWSKRQETRDTPRITLVNRGFWVLSFIPTRTF